jgi:aspartyl protease family protein
MDIRSCIENADGDAPRAWLYVWATSKEPEALSDHHHGPWSHPPEPGPLPSAPQRRRFTRGFFIWLAIVGLGLGLYVALQLLFPGQLDRTDQAGALQVLGWLALVSSGLVFARRMRFGEVARNIGIWAAIAGVAILAYSFRGEAAAAFQRVRGELIPAMAVPAGKHAMTITAAGDGGFYVMGQVNGATVRFAIDTGANGVLLSPADAARAGVDMASLKFTAPGETANGVGYMAPVTLGSLDVGQIRLTGVPAAVDKAPMSTSLLGMAFLKRLDSFEVKGDQLTLRWRG